MASHRQLELYVEHKIMALLAQKDEKASPLQIEVAVA